MSETQDDNALTSLSKEELLEFAKIGYKYKHRSKTTSKSRYEKQKDTLSLRRKIKTQENRIKKSHERKAKLEKLYEELKRRKAEEIVHSRPEQTQARHDKIKTSRKVSEFTQTEDHSADSPPTMEIPLESDEEALLNSLV